MKRKFLGIITILLSVICLTGCTTWMAYSYELENGDKIKIQIETNDGYKITSGIPFEILKENKLVSKGSLITIIEYNDYIESIENDTKANVLEKDTREKMSYTLYSYNDKEFNYVIKIDNSNTGVLLSNSISEESAKECFDKLTFSIEK